MAAVSIEELGKPPTFASEPDELAVVDPVLREEWRAVELRIRRALRRDAPVEPVEVNVTKRYAGDTSTLS